MSGYYLFDHFKVNYNVPISAHHTPPPHILDYDSVVSAYVLPFSPHPAIEKITN